MSEFTAEKVVQAYEQLQTCNDTNLKAEADVYLNSFMVDYTVNLGIC